MRIVAIIPARGNSKRLPRKNIYPFFGRPLMQWAIEACQASKHIQEIYVSTEDPEIKAVALGLGVRVIDRPMELAQDDVWTQKVLQHAVTEIEKDGTPLDIVARIQANSPQVEADKIDEAIEKLESAQRWEIFSVDEEGLEDAAIHVMRRLVVFQQAFSVANVFHGSEDGEDFCKEFLVDGFCGPLGPIADVVRIGATGHGGGDVRIGE